jgi:hypothetical protein
VFIRRRSASNGVQTDKVKRWCMEAGEPLLLGEQSKKGDLRLSYRRRLVWAVKWNTVAG